VSYPKSPDDWRAQAACAQLDPALFFPDGGEAETWQAKRVCAACPVRAECLRFALAGPEPYGIWGGLTEGERRELTASPHDREVA